MSGSLGGKRIFLSRAFLLQLEPGLYGLYRSVLEEGTDGQGRTHREKIKDVGPFGVFRKCQPGESPDLRSVHPDTGEALDLKTVSG